MSAKVSKMSFNDFCYKILDGMYEPRLPLESQCTGYLQLRKMVVENIKPATQKQYERWKTKPTAKELFSEPDIKYLTFLHELIRTIVRNNWKKIKKMKVE